jgi:hypothetical protein
MELNFAQSYANPHANPHAPGCPWHNLAAGLGAPNVKWCEETLCHWLSEPANAISNVSYVIVALIIWRQARGHAQPRRLAMVIALMGVLSAVYHASNVSITQLADFIGMFIALGYLLALNIQTLWPDLGVRVGRFIAGVVLALTPVSILMYLQRWPAQMLIMILGGLLAVLEIYAYRQSKRSGRDLSWACLFGILAVTATALDHRRVFCIPGNHIIQGHALWHVFSATAIFFLAKKILPPGEPPSHGL